MGRLLNIVLRVIIGAVCPTSICMWVVAILVALTDSSSQTKPILICTHNPNHTPVEKLNCLLSNAAGFVVVMAGVTLLLVLLASWKLTKFLEFYMRVFTFIAFMYMGGDILGSLLKHFSVQVDPIFMFLVVLTISSFGAVTILPIQEKIPLVFTNGIAVTLGIVVGTWWTRTPELTTWVTLVAMALYDTVSVLTKAGPIWRLLESAEVDDIPVPAFTIVWENCSDSYSYSIDSPSLSYGDKDDEYDQETDLELRGKVEPLESYVDHDDDSPRGLHHGSNELTSIVVIDYNDSVFREMGQLGNNRSARAKKREITKIGLGDFVFYSLLAGTASMYGLLTFGVCYLAVEIGVVCTLVLHSFDPERPLPLLTLPILLGVVSFFLVRLLTAPVVAGPVNYFMFP